jgi:hypothetical protein
MKKTITFALILFISVCVQAQKAEKVYSIVKQIHSSDWYFEQATLWKAEIEKDDQNGEAWLNYYTANRMYKLTSNNKDWTNHKGNILSDLNKIVDACGEAIPGSFEYNYLKWYNGGNNPENFPYLQKAYELAPNRVETYDEFIVYYLLHHEENKMKEFCEKWFRSNDLSPGILNFGYNMLMSVEKESVLFTNGDNDSYPLWVLQMVKNIQPDVKVININLLMVEEYRNTILKKLGLPELKINYKKLSSVYDLKYRMIKHFVDHYPNNIYFATTIDKNIYDSFKNDIYLEGLAFKYSPENYDNMAILKRNYEQYFLLDYIKTTFSEDISASVIRMINANYLLPFMSLYKHYSLSNDANRQEEIKELILLIAERSGHLEEVKKDLK